MMKALRLGIPGNNHFWKSADHQSVALSGCA
jgi:hypothetical protein